MDKREPKKLQMFGKFGGVDVTGAKVGQIIQVESVDETGKPTAWKAVDKPAKLSDLKNDLFYANATEALTITKADFIPKYVLDDDGNPTDEIDYLYYKGTPALDWFTSPDKIGFIVKWSDDNSEEYTANHHVPNITAEYDCAEYTESGYGDYENRQFPWLYCSDCSIQIASGANALNYNEIIPEDAFYIQSWGWNWDSENNAVTGFDSITIYKVDSKKISKELYDHSDIDDQISELYDGIGNVFGYVNSVEQTANQARTAAENAQTAAENAQTAANNAQTAAENAQDAASENAAALLTLTSVNFTMPASMYSVTYGNGKFVAVSNVEGDTAAYSEDGNTWAKATLPYSISLRSVTYGNGKFVAVPSRAGDTAVYSEDGNTWAKTTLSYSVSWSSVTYGNGKFVAVAFNTRVAAYSEDGITWTTPTTAMPYSSNWLSVTYGNGKFVAVSGSAVAYSEDGITWTNGTIGAMPSSASWSSVTYGNGKFVAVASNTRIAAYSEDGITWSSVTTAMPTSSDWRSVTYGNGKFVAVSIGNTAAYSEDGITWAKATLPFSNWRSVTYGNGKFVAVNNSLNDKTAACSEDGINWVNCRDVITMNGVEVTTRIRKLLSSP